MKRLLPILLLVFSVGVGAYDEDDLKKLKANKDCMKCDLSGAYLYRADLDEANLTGTIFCGTIMPDKSYNDTGC